MAKLPAAHTQFMPLQGSFLPCSLDRPASLDVCVLVSIAKLADKSKVVYFDASHLLHHLMFFPKGHQMWPLDMPSYLTLTVF